VIQKRIYANVRCMKLADMPAVVAIEADSHLDPWSEEDFLKALSNTNCIAMVAESGNTVIGYIVYLFQKNSIKIINMAVYPKCQRHGVGERIIDNIKAKCARRGGVACLDVRETNLPAQLFFKAQGFKATKVIRDAYEDDPDHESAIRMVFEMVSTRNRIDAFIK
jgi:[ribosomal protein S18]-alanine N-acetyltransferase